MKILRRLGAIEGTMVRSGCQTASTLTLRVTTAVPTPKSDAAAAAISSSAADQALMQRFDDTGKPDAKPFKAEWTTVTLSSKDYDCELLRRMSTQVFEPLGIRIDKPIRVCPRANTIAAQPPKLVVSALIGAVDR